MTLSAALSLLAVLLLLYVAFSHLRLSPRREPPRTRECGETFPSVSVIRPVRGVDAGARENLRAALEIDYPGEVETLFVVDDEHEAALPLIRAAIRAHDESGQPGSARVVLAGAPPPTRTGKLNAMIAGHAGATGELVAFADSDTRPDSRMLFELVRTLRVHPAAGAAFAPVVATAPPSTAGDVAYALMLNGLYGPDAEVSAREAGDRLPFIMGQFMVLRREALVAIGGLECAEGQLVDDMFLGLRLCAAGYDNAVARYRVPIVSRGLSVRGFVSVFLRWIAFSRSGLPARSKVGSWLRAGAFWLGVVLCVTAAASGEWLAALLNLFVPLSVAVSLVVLHRQLGGAPLPLRYAWVPLAILLCAPAAYLRLALRHEIDWRGRHYRLDRRFRLAEGPVGRSR